MGKGRVMRAQGAKGKRWRKGQSGSSNPGETSHRQAARGKFSDHLSRGRLPPSSAPPLTAAALASLHDSQGEGDALERADLMEDDCSSTVLTRTASSSALTLIETAHPVFGPVRKLWSSPTQSHQVICAVLAAVSEVVRSREGKGTETEYFGALMSVLESSDDEKSVAAISYLLCLLLPSVPREVLQLKYGTTCKILTDQQARHENSSSTALLKSLVRAVTLLLEAQPLATWKDSLTQKVYQTILNYTVHPKPKLRKMAQSGVVAILRDSTDSGESHPAATPTAIHCRYILSQGGVETASLHVLGLLRDCMANLSTQHIKTLSEVILQTMTLGSTLVRTRCLHTLHGALSSVAGPRGLTAHLTAKLIAALYDHQPGLADGQLLLAWLTVMQAAHSRLASLNQRLGVGHLVRLFSTAISCLRCHRSEVNHTAVSAMQTLLTDVVGPYSASLDSLDCKPQLHTIQKVYMAVLKGLDYQYRQWWRSVLKTVTVFHRVAGERCHSVMAQTLPSLCSLHSLPDFKCRAELEEAVGVAITTMGPHVVLNHVPLELDSTVVPPSFHRSWLLPVLRDHVCHAHLSFFMDSLLPLAGRMRTRAESYRKAGRQLETKAFTLLYHQVWSLLPSFSRGPSDVEDTFPGLARILGSALSDNPELRVSIATSLRQLIESSREKDKARAVLGRYSKNYLPILFNLYTGDREGEREGEGLAVLQCVQAYISITDQTLVTSLAGTALQRISEPDTEKDKRHRLLDLVATMVEFLPPAFLLNLLNTIAPLLDSADGTLQKKSYKVLQQLLSSSNHTSKAFVQDHLLRLTSLLTESLSTSSSGSKKPRLGCLLSLVDHISEDTADFIATITPEVILCTKETNEKCRSMAYQLLVRAGHAAQQCYGVGTEEAVTRYMHLVLAGLAGSAHMVSASVISLSRLVYEFHDVLSCGLVSRLVATMCKLLSSRIREVVKAAFGFIKVTIRVLPPSELSPHLEELIGGVMLWSANPKSHFRLKARFILERLIRKFGFELVCGLVQPKHHKLLAHIRRTTEREKKKKKKKAAVARDDGMDSEPSAVESGRLGRLSYEDLLRDMEEEEEGEGEVGGGRGLKTSGMKIRRGGSWIKESTSGDDPVNLLDASLAHRISITDPHQSRPPVSQPFPLMEGGGGGGGGRGIYRKTTGKQEFDYGSEYRAKRARGDVKVKGQPDPYAYVPLLGAKLNRRKRAKLAGQFKGVVRKARTAAVSKGQHGKKR